MIYEFAMHKFEISLLRMILPDGKAIRRIRRL